jgi:coenzyme A diphosphatase NUDT7
LEQRKWLGYVFPIHYFDYEADQQKFVIWGLTAAILMKCASIIYEQPRRLNELQQTIGLLSPKL